MPNLWTRSSHAIQEAMNGPRTEDVEFTNLIEKIKVIEMGVVILCNMLQTFENQTQSLGLVFKQLSDSIDKIYDSSSPFHSLANDIKEAHVAMLNYYDTFKKNTSSLSSRTSEWSVLFTQVQEQIKQRNDKKKVYDHYEQKLDKLYEINAAKKSKSKRDEELLERNELKFKKAAEEYAETSEKSFKTITNILDRRYDIINPVFSDFIKNESLFFQNVTKTLSKFEEIEEIFNKIKAEISSKYKYDPWKGIKGRDYIKKVSFRKKCTNYKKITENPISDMLNIGKEEESIKSSFPKPSYKSYSEFMKIQDDLNNNSDSDKEEVK